MAEVDLDLSPEPPRRGAVCTTAGSSLCWRSGHLMVLCSVDVAVRGMGRVFFLGERRPKGQSMVSPQTTASWVII